MNTNSLCAHTNFVSQNVSPDSMLGFHWNLSIDFNFRMIFKWFSKILFYENDHIKIRRVDKCIQRSASIISSPSFTLWYSHSPGPNPNPWCPYRKKLLKFISLTLRLHFHRISLDKAIWHSGYNPRIILNQNLFLIIGKWLKCMLEVIFCRWE